MSRYKTAQQVAEVLGVTERTIRNYAERYEWFGGRLGNTGSWVFTDEEVERILVMPRPSAGRPRKPIVDLGEESAPTYVPIPG